MSQRENERVMAENKRIVTLNRLSEQRLLEENRALHSQVARLTYDL